MMFYLKGHQNYQKSNSKVPKKCPLIFNELHNSKSYLLADLMPLEIKYHTVPHLKGLNSGLEPQTSCGHGSNSMDPMLA